MRTSRTMVTVPCVVRGGGVAYYSEAVRDNVRLARVLAHSGEDVLAAPHDRLPGRCCLDLARRN